MLNIKLYFIEQYWRSITALNRLHRAKAYEGRSVLQFCGSANARMPSSNYFDNMTKFNLF